MVSLPVYDKSGSKVGTYDIDVDSIAPTINKQLLHDVVVMYQANLRQGTKGSKSRGMVSGSTKKMYRQKGTGNARAGSRRTNVRRGGGHAFALKTRDFSYRLPKKVLRAAVRMAVAAKIKTDSVVVLDDFQLEQPKTKEVAGVLDKLGLSGKSATIATAEHSSAMYKSARNIPRVDVAPVSDLNALQILKPHRLVMTKGALDAFKERVGV